MDIDPTQPCDDQGGQFVILAAIDPSTKRPYPLVLNKATGELRVNAEFTGDVVVDIDLPDSISGKTITLTGGLDQLPDVACKAGANLSSDDGNAGVMWIGGNDVAVNNGFKLPIGEDVPVACQNLNLLYVRGTLGDKLHYLVG